MADGRIPLCPHPAFHRHVRISPFIPGHRIMVIIHGWSNFMSILTGWKKNPQYLLK
jgi:hypothetical protein